MAYLERCRLAHAILLGQDTGSNVGFCVHIQHLADWVIRRGAVKISKHHIFGVSRTLQSFAKLIRPKGQVSFEGGDEGNPVYISLPPGQRNVVGEFLSAQVVWQLRIDPLPVPTPGPARNALENLPAKMNSIAIVSRKNLVPAIAR